MGEDTPVSKMGTSGGRSESRAHDDGGGHTSEHDGHQRWQIRESRTPSETNLKPRHLPALRPDEIAASYCKIALETSFLAEAGMLIGDSNRRDWPTGSSDKGAV
ncbi:hypothetical protein O6H91_Y297500 [Diphasiastrum complanatum]|nr:hypothetical protein O6H91_Y297500 [Diphasiastrum complanatum]